MEDQGTAGTEEGRGAGLSREESLRGRRLLIRINLIAIAVAIALLLADRLMFRDFLSVTLRGAVFGFLFMALLNLIRHCWIVRKLRARG